MALDICILLRVHSRLDDLAVCVEAIKRHWTRHKYRIVVVGNGKVDGYRIPREVAANVHKVIELDANYGHLGGSRQLLVEGVQHIPADCAYTVLLEADTWVFTDALVDKYVRRMGEDEIVWSSAEWVEKWFSLALDFAIVDSRFIRDNPALFDFPARAESYICNYLMDRGARFAYIHENMPVHIPGLLKRFYWVSGLKRFYQRCGGRFRSFPEAGMVTHHTEVLANGIEEKKLLVNATLGGREFDLGEESWIRRGHRRLLWMRRLARAMPRSKWFRRKRRR